jgi:hypothetical protein
MDKILILPDVTLRDEHKLKVRVRNRMLRRMFEPKKGDIGGWTKGKVVPLLN